MPRSTLVADHSERLGPPGCQMSWLPDVVAFDRRKRAFMRPKLLQHSFPSSTQALPIRSASLLQSSLAMSDARRRNSPRSNLQRLYVTQAANDQNRVVFIVVAEDSAQGRRLSPNWYSLRQPSTVNLKYSDVSPFLRFLSAIASSPLLRQTQTTW
jgi:hypothetical protein